MSSTDISGLFDLGFDDPTSEPQNEEPQKRKRGRPTREEAAARAMEKEEAIPHYGVFRQPVGVTFLGKVVGKQPRQIEKRLEKCPVAEYSTHKGKQVPLYDFVTAMAYLIPPRGNIEDWFAQQNAASLPPYVNKMWWDSAHQRNRVMLSSNDLWLTDQIQIVFGRIAMMIRQETKMWVEDLPEKENLTDKQYAALVDASSRLVDDVRKVLTALEDETFSMSHRISAELEEAGTISDADRAPEEDDEGDGE